MSEFVNSVAVSDIIYRAYRIAGILDEAGRGASQSEMQDGLQVLNSMLDAWKSERLTVYAILRTETPVYTAKQTYTIGWDGGEIDLERPERIEQAGLLLTNVNPVIEQPMQVLTVQEWQALSPKQLTSTLPTKLYYEPEVPLGIIYLWPIPTQAWKMALYTWQRLNEFAGVTDNVVVPKAWREAMEYQLAIRLAAQFPRRQKMSPWSVQQAGIALSKVKAINSPYLQMVCETGSMSAGQKGRRYSIISNRWE